MHARSLMTLLLGAALLLSGCRVSGEVENQAYVLVLGVDRLEDGSLELTARVPQIGKSDDSGEQPGGGGYLVFSGSGDGYAQAKEALEQATPRQMNLSHIEMLVASENLAREADFGALIAQLSETPHLYTTARFVVCEGSARSFIEAQETVIGTRLSSEINAMLNHFAEHGYIPDSSFADVYYMAGSIYSDPVAIRGFMAAAEEASKPAAALIDTPAPINENISSPMRQRFSGAALFRDGRLAGLLDVGQTRLMNLIRGTITAFPFDCDGKIYTLTTEGAATRTVKLEDGHVTLALRMRLSTLDEVCDEDARRLEAALAEALATVVYTCQTLGTDPFGFAESAAGQFLTVEQWQAFSWRERYAGAAVDVDVEVHSASED